MIATLLLWLTGILRHRRLRVAGTAAGVALTVGLLAALAIFLVSAGSSMTSRVLSTVPIDWQVQVIPGVDPNGILAALRQTTGANAVHLVRYADVAGFEAHTGDTTQTTGPGQVVAFDGGYVVDFPAEVRPLSGAEQGVLIAQQTAANLHVGPGDTVSVKLVDQSTVVLKVSGVIDLPDADSLFQAVGLPPQAAPQAPPDNVVIVPENIWMSAFADQQRVRPDTTRLQLHIRLGHEALPANPASALTAVAGAGRNLEARVAGQALLANNLAARLEAVREDALYASVLFLFLGLPGVALAVAVTLAVTAAGSPRRRIEQGLLRVRGATRARIMLLTASEAAVAAVAGTAVGVSGVLALSRLLPGLAATSASGVAALAAAGIVGLALGFAAFLIPAWQDARSVSANAARRVISRQDSPLWQRLGLDLLMLVVSGLLFWQSASVGYQIVLAPEGVAATSVDYKAFLAPALFWLGMTLLAIRVVATVISARSPFLALLVSPVAGMLTPLVAASLSAQASRITRGVAMTSMALSFAAATAIFNDTYNAQSRVDAELTNGADVTVRGTAKQPAGADLEKLSNLSEAAAVEPMQHRFAYVGADLQDLYGIDPTGIAKATTMSDAYFSGGSANAVLGTLAAIPNGVLVSEETVQDFQLQLGDTINLRLLSGADRQYHPVAFTFIGVAREFPTAPKDSFLVANASYIARVTGSDASEYVLMRARHDPGALARQVSGALQSEPFLKVSDVGQAAHLIGSSLTAVDLAGLTKIELTFSVLLAAASAGLMLGLGLVERRRSFAVLSALGARPHQLHAFVWSEAVVVLTGGFAFGAVTGVGTAWMLVRLLTGVFDPPPEALSLPWIYLALVAAIVVASVLIGVQAVRPSLVSDVRQLKEGY